MFRWIGLFLMVLLYSCGSGTKVEGISDEQMQADPELAALINSLENESTGPEDYIRVATNLETIHANDPAAIHVLIIGTQKFPTNMGIYYELGRLQLKNGLEMDGYQNFRRVMTSAEAGIYLDRISPYFLDVYSVQAIVYSPADEAYASMDSIGQYVYYQTNTNGNWDIYRLSMTGGVEEGIITLPTNEENPNIDPGSQYLLFTSDKDDERPTPLMQKLRDIYYYDMKTLTTTNLTQNFSNDYLPSLCKLGKEVAFVSERNDLSENSTFIEKYSNVFMMEPSGIFQVAMTKGDYIDSNPSFSCSRRAIYFDSNRGGEYQNIYRLEIETKEMREVLPAGNYNNFSPYTSTGDTSMVYVSDRDGNYELYQYNFRTHEEERLTSADAEDLHPIFIPNSNKILFHSNRSGSYDIYLLDLESKNISPTPYSILARIDDKITALRMVTPVVEE